MNFTKQSKVIQFELAHRVVTQRTETTLLSTGFLVKFRHVRCSSHRERTRADRRLLWLSESLALNQLQHGLAPRFKRKLSPHWGRTRRRQDAAAAAAISDDDVADKDDDDDADKDDDDDDDDADKDGDDDDDEDDGVYSSDDTNADEGCR
ncbi:hypothetical protein ElyMa_005230400 [Elysia marginata]|uniref:Uncharacterized protein n=1 Tax=Elysia marginata TaxID=1093978 RepID=A0AAV4K227_9GAST|nr:hypothetical protein ElyMa_005230400 [Elysia marginata]